MDVRIGLVLVILASACGNSDPKGDGWKLNGDMGPDVGADVGPDSGSDSGGQDVGIDAGTVGQPLTFRLTNGSGSPVFADSGIGGTASCGGGAWVEVFENGESRGIVSSCTECACDEAPNCTVCLLDCAPGQDPNYAQLDVRESRTFEWDGLLRVDDVVDGNQCTALRAPEAATLTARFCWGYGFELTSDPFGEITEVECASVEFSPADGLVEFTIEPTARDAVEFRLTNTTEATLYARLSPGSFCDIGSWLSLEQQGTALDISADCGTCACADVGNANLCPAPCPGVACAAPTLETYELVPGGNRAFSWNRTAQFEEMVDGMRCEASRLITGPVTAQMCWGTSMDENFALVGTTCETMEFDPFEATLVSYDIQ